MNFEDAVEKVNKLKNTSSNFSNEDLLQLYAYYKQATIGDINIEQPSIINYTNYLKWNAWNDLRGLTKKTAMKKYIKYVDKLSK